MSVLLVSHVESRDYRGTMSILYNHLAAKVIGYRALLNFGVSVCVCVFLESETSLSYVAPARGEYESTGLPAVFDCAGWGSLWIPSASIVGNHFFVSWFVQGGPLGCSQD